MIKSKRGNIFLVVMGIATLLFFALGSFMKTTMSRQYFVQKLGESSYAKEFANSLAVLSVHYLKSELRKPDGDPKIRQAFLYPYDHKNKKDLKGEINVKVFDITSNSGKSMIYTLQNETDLKNVSIVEDKIFWELSDLKAIEVGTYSSTIPYPREKTGLVKFNFKIQYKKAGQKDYIVEPYQFASDIKVVANIIPVLSKFTLYIEKALGDKEPTLKNTRRFNVIDTDVNGTLNNSENIVKPWILNNNGEEDKEKEKSSKRPDSYEGLVNDTRGFVYIGGGSMEIPIKLSIACGDTDSEIGNMGQFGEDFHFYKKPEKDGGYFKKLASPDWGEEKGVFCANLGICNDNDPDSNYSEYSEYLGNKNFKKNNRNSIFKLYGTDEMFCRGIFSPTLVLGYVDSMFASIRIYKSYDDEEPFHVLNYYETDSEFSVASNEDDEDCDPDLIAFKEVYEHENIDGDDLTFMLYKLGYGSRIEAIPYNNDYTYAFKRDICYPFENSFTDKELEALCDKNSKEDIFVRIPNTDEAKYASIYSDVKDLTDLSLFLATQTLSINATEGRRIAHFIKFLPLGSEKEKGDEKDSIVIDDGIDIGKLFLTLLKTKGILLEKEGGLDFNGWLYIDSDKLSDDFVLPLKFGKNNKMLSHGGIILSKGSFSIDDDIISDNDSHLTLIALGQGDCEGNIKINSKVTKVYASLIARNGYLYLEDENRKNVTLDIHGNIVLQEV